jgi:hypothetical protein
MPENAKRNICRAATEPIMSEINPPKYPIKIPKNAKNPILIMVIAFIVSVDIVLMNPIAYAINMLINTRNITLMDAMDVMDAMDPKDSKPP